MHRHVQWPEGNQSSAVITVDFNDIHGVMTDFPEVAGREKTLSVWRYGTLRGVDRLLGLLDECSVSSTWCVPAVVAEEQHLLIKRIADAGHEIACSGDRHQDFSALTAEQQASSVREGLERIAQVTGIRPKGFRTPAGQWKPGLPQALQQMGLTWSSSWRGDDLPYFHPQTSLVELPLHYELEDAPYFAFNLSPAIPVGQSRIASYRDTLGNMTMDFEGYHRFGLCYLMRLHPEIIGTAGRIGILRELLNTFRRNAVWLATAGDVARFWQEQPANDASHPAEIFSRVRGNYSV